MSLLFAATAAVVLSTPACVLLVYCTLARRTEATTCKCQVCMAAFTHIGLDVHFVGFRM